MRSSYPDLSANKGETAVHGCHCPGEVLAMRELLARPWIGVCVPFDLSLSSCKTSHYRKVHKSYLLISHFFFHLGYVYTPLAEKFDRILLLHGTVHFGPFTRNFERLRLATSRPLISS